MGCLSSTLGSTGKMVPEVPATSVVETVYGTDKNGISTAIIVNGHRTPGHDQPVSPDKITIEEDPTAGALTTKKVEYCYFLVIERMLAIFCTSCIACRQPAGYPWG